MDTPQDYEVTRDRLVLIVAAMRDERRRGGAAA